MENPDVKIFNHNNPNAIFGIITITSMGIYQTIDFKIYV